MNTTEELDRLSTVLVDDESVIATAVRDDDLLAATRGPIGPDLLCELGISGATLEPLDAGVVRVEVLGNE